MATIDRQALGIPSAGSKRDWNIYTGSGGGGGAPATVTGVTRYTFWTDYSKFDVSVRKLIVQNVAFEIWKDAGQTQPASFYIDGSQTNDKPDALIRGSTGGSSNNSIFVDSAILPPPYYINITTLTQPSNSTFTADQGLYNYNENAGFGLGTGSSGKIVQSFVPSSPVLTGLKFKDLFHVGSNSDHTLFNNLIFEVWDTNKNILASYSLSPYKDAALNQLGSTGWSSISWATADDGGVYWYDLEDVTIAYPSYVKVIPGLTHYFCIRQDTASAAHHYGITSNTTSTGAWDNNSNAYYINGQAYTAPFASTTLTAVGTNISVNFLSLRNNGRMGITFLWDSAAYYWYNPTAFLDQFRFVKSDTDKRI